VIFDWQIHFLMRYLFFFSLITMGACMVKSTPQTVDLFKKGKDLGTVDKKLEEASGLVESVANPDHFWTINDSGNPPDVFLIDKKADTRLTCKLAKIRNRDFEDIAIGAGPIEGKNYVYVADIGDNLAQYQYKYIYRFEEPTLVTDEKKITITKFDTLTIKLPDGTRDTETIMIDPLTHDLYLVSKREEMVRLYFIKYPFPKGTIVPEKVATLPFTKIVAGSISTDGTEVLLKNYDSVYYWKKKDIESIPALLKSKHQILAYDKEPQGEAIAWARDGSGYYTLSESIKDFRGKLFFYKRK